MGLFGKFKTAFHGERADDQHSTDQMPGVSLSPLPKAISGMPKGQHIDRLDMMHAKDIGFHPGFGPEQEGFWEYKEQKPNGHSKADYLEMASHIPEVRERLDSGESLESLMRDGRVSACAAQYFSPGNMIKVESYPDGHYEYAAGGRHRIAAAQELGIEIPVQVNEYGNKDGYAISPWEKQERYDAMRDYMRVCGYSEADKAACEADPEWQRLYREFDHPVNRWEPIPLAEEERGMDTMTDAEPMQSDVTQSAASSDRFSSSYDDRIRQTPSLESDRWAGERGESECAPHSDAARQILQERGIAGVQYQDGVPDFSPFSESTVQLGYMTDARHSQGLSSGRDGKDSFYADIEDGQAVSMSHHADKDSMADLHMKYDKPGSFEQADILTAEQWTADKRDGREWTAEDVAQYRQDHGLTWHECNDMETMQMIPEAINADFGHLGGVGEVKETQRAVEEALRDYDQEEMAEEVDYDSLTPEELDAVARDHGHYDDKGKWMPDDLPQEASEETDIESSTVEVPDDLPPSPSIDSVLDDAAADNSPDEEEVRIDDLQPDGQLHVDGLPDDAGDNSPDGFPNDVFEDETPDTGDEESIIDTQEAEEPAAEEAARQETEESFDSLADEEPEMLLDDAADYSDLADEATYQSLDSSVYEDFAGKAEENFTEEAADYSDLADDVDNDSLGDTSFDSSDLSIDSGDTGSFDGGGEAIE